MNTDPPVITESRIAEAEKTLLRRATPVAPERAPTGAKPAFFRIILDIVIGYGRLLTGEGFS